ncbi:MAG TPA: thioredoxin domain-containing protein [Maribacter sp.]|nr:thioredoxin domain-containing protein [Maribacter sp.]
MPNKLHLESSPYLLQHSENPVDWFPWSDEAFRIAKEKDLPVLLSIGYSACHWCHVMQHESFEDVEIANMMNSKFINIKVDREERPDIDDIYMSAVQTMTGQGGWPLTVFLTPDAKPFFGGTYFPPQPKYGHPGFPQILQAISDAYLNRKEDLLKSADSLLGNMKRFIAFEGQSDSFNENDAQEIINNLKERYDKDFGGFGETMKFPNSMTLDFLLKYYSVMSDSYILDIVKDSVDKMLIGGIFDHIGGGFHRYTVDREWLTPHFEKMLYDNALMAKLLLNLYQVTHDEVYKTVGLEVIDYVCRDMISDKGLFYSAEDADSNGEEGLFYTWTVDELKAFLNDDEIQLISEIFTINETPNFESRSILHMNSIDTMNRFWIAQNQDNSELKTLRSEIFNNRSPRVRPFKDTKSILSWNSLMVQSLCEAYLITGDEKYKNIAIQNAKTWLELYESNGGLIRSINNHVVSGSGYLEDYSYFVNTCISLHEVTLDLFWLEKAKTIADEMIDLFWYEPEKRFYDTSRHESDLIYRPINPFDNATPSGTSEANRCLRKLGFIFNISKYKNIHILINEKMTDYVRGAPLSFSNQLSVEYSNLLKNLEVLITSPTLSLARPFLHFMGNKYIPDRTLLGWIQEQNGELSKELNEILLLQGREPNSQDAVSYVCSNFSCELPTESYEEFEEQIESKLKS